MKKISRRQFVAGSTITIAGLGVFGLVGWGKLAPFGTKQTNVTVHLSDDELFEKFAEYLETNCFDLPDSDYKMPLLEATFTRKEAEFLYRFPFLPKTPQQLAAKYDTPIETFLEIIKPMERKGFIYSSYEDGGLKYSLREVVFYWFRMPGWPGKTDEYNMKISPAINGYYNDVFSRNLNGDPTNGLRAIPLQTTIRDTRTVEPFENVAAFVETQDYCTVSTCACRHRHHLDPKYENCDYPMETCMHFGDLGRYILRNDMGRKISQKETLRLLTECAEAGLVHGISNAKTDIDTICNCCACCCLFLEKTKAMPIPGGHHKSNYKCSQADKCEACGLCEERCPMDALKLDEDDNLIFDADRCLGCGVCVYKCPTGNLSLERRPVGSDIPDNFKEFINRHFRERGRSPIKFVWNNTSFDEFLGMMF